ncbi:MAG: hypothetical protein ACLGH0_06485 [Thermoanaerobaculia bacterium]
MRAAVLFAVVFVGTQVQACMCAGLPTHERSFAAATAVFEGVVVGKRVTLKKDWNDWYLPVNEYEFAVVRVWKGNAAERITMIGGTSGCSRQFAGGRRYVVFAVSHDDELTDLDCGSTHRVQDDPLRYMGAPLATFSEPRRIPSSKPFHYDPRLHFVAGAAMFGNLVTHGEDEIIYGNEAAVGMLVAGMLCALVPLVGVAASFKQKRRALVLLVLAVTLVCGTFFVAGRLAIAGYRPLSWSAE